MVSGCGNRRVPRRRRRACGPWPSRGSRPGPGLQRARMVLLAAEGLPNAEIGRQVGRTWQTVIAWRSRYEAGGVEALAGLGHSGRPPVIDEPVVIASTL